MNVYGFPSPSVTPRSPSLPLPAVPPNIVDTNSSKSNIVVREKDNVTLSCRADGFPKPVIKWRREDTQYIETSDGRKGE